VKTSAKTRAETNSIAFEWRISNKVKKRITVTDLVFKQKLPLLKYILLIFFFLISFLTKLSSLAFRT